ncbi:hypothetical protein HYPSUDRAFT_213201 [Hypholoma sublateritium FD-334 SS-4]|uniref:Uncharacterized protein n=1 Tax=Hypholoma sublateritium (strain FD-334 SS-4) TaxID=945553 RepID=A0A0D2LGA7_HYPSF|nr:hypothetical protein HYPSUDRAFT_213201 [Hypholoma sublateritium FD-334 SS-4]
MAEIVAAILGGGFALAAAGYAAGTGFTARHEAVHAQQVAYMNRLIAEFEDAYYRKKEVTQAEWNQFMILREKARGVEAEYEDSIETYKETPMHRFISKWKKRLEVRKKKKELKSSNRILTSHYNSCPSNASSISEEYWSPPRSSASYNDDDKTRKWVLSWAREVADSELDPEHDSEGLHEAAFRLVKKGRRLARHPRAAVRRRRASRRNSGGGASANFKSAGADAGRVEESGGPELIPSVVNLGSVNKKLLRKKITHAHPHASNSLGRDSTNGTTAGIPRPSHGGGRFVRSGGGCCGERGRYGEASDADDEDGFGSFRGPSPLSLDGMHDADVGGFRVDVDGAYCTEFSSGVHGPGELDDAHWLPSAPTASPAFTQMRMGYGHGHARAGFEKLREIGGQWRQQQQHGIAVEGGYEAGAGASGMSFSAGVWGTSAFGCEAPSHTCAHTIIPAFSTLNVPSPPAFRLIQRGVHTQSHYPTHQYHPQYHHPHLAYGLGHAHSGHGSAYGGLHKSLEASDSPMSFYTESHAAPSPRQPLYFGGGGGAGGGGGLYDRADYAPYRSGPCVMGRAFAAMIPSEYGVGAYGEGAYGGGGAYAATVPVAYGGQSFDPYYAHQQNW